MAMFSWFHGRMKRDEAENLLQPREDGLFLVRESNNYPGDYTLCVCSEGKVEHYHIIYKDNKLTIDEEEFFENLNQLVEVLIETERILCTWLFTVTPPNINNLVSFLLRTCSHLC